MAKQKTPTNALAEQIINKIFEDGGYAWRNNTLGVPDFKKGVMRKAPKTGVSDILGIVPHKTFRQRPPVGQLIAIEIKTGRDTLKPEQIGFLEAINRRGGLAFAVKTYDEFLTLWQI
jgi:hypothetical protein